MAITSKITVYSPSIGAWVWIHGTVRFRQHEWAVAYVMIPATLGQVISKMQDKLEDEFNVTYIGSGLQHWDSGLKHVIDPDMPQTWVGIDWQGVSAAQSPIEPDTDPRPTHEVMHQIRQYAWEELGV